MGVLVRQRAGKSGCGSSQTEGAAALADLRCEVPEYCLAETSGAAGGIARCGEQDLTASAEAAEHE